VSIKSTKFVENSLPPLSSNMIFELMITSAIYFGTVEGLKYLWKTLLISFIFLTSLLSFPTFKRTFS